MIELKNMLLKISTTHQPATDLGYLLHKHPDKVQTFDVSGGNAVVFYPEATAEKCTVALLLQLDSIDLVRKLKTPGNTLMLHHYVNDRPYTASSFTSVAIAKTFSSALNGTCKDRPELVEQIMLFEVSIPVMKVRAREGILENIFEPLGYQIEVTQHPLDEVHSEWGMSQYVSLKLTNQLTLKDLLSHLYVLFPVFDNEKHHYISEQEVEKLISKAGDWLQHHPEKEFITRRFLGNLSSLAKTALARLIPEEEILENEQEETSPEPEKKVRLHQVRLNAALEQLKASGAKKVLDLGCGEGRLIRMLIKERQFERVLGMDVSYRELLKAKSKLYYDNMSPRQQERVLLIQGSLMYKDARLKGYDAAAIVEVIEHMDEDRLDAFEQILFGYIAPQTVIITTPNSEYNVKYEFLEEDTFRHNDHRFEWTRQQFEDWATRMSEQFDYQYNITPIGDLDKEVGAPSQMAVFTKK